MRTGDQFHGEGTVIPQSMGNLESLAEPMSEPQTSQSFCDYITAQNV